MKIQAFERFHLLKPLLLRYDLLNENPIINKMAGEQMNHHLQQLGKMILNKRNDISAKVHRDRMAEIPMTEAERNHPEFKKIEEQIMKIRFNFFTIIGEALIEDLEQESAFQKVLEWGRWKGEYCFRIGSSLEEALKDAALYRKYIWHIVEEEALARSIPASVIFKVISIVDPLIEKAINYFSVAYVELYQKAIEEAKTAYNELSVPVIPLMKGVGILPLIGKMDADRAEMLMENTLRHSGRLNLNHLILDLSGVQEVNGLIAQQIFQVMDALELIGVKAILTGIRPDMAQTMVKLGLVVDPGKVRANLELALLELQLLKG